MNLRNRLIWIAALTLGFTAVQWVSSQRKAERERAAFLKSKLMPLASECIQQAQARSPGLHGALTLQVGLVADGPLAAVVARVQLAAASEIHDPALAACIEQRAKSLQIPEPLRSGPERLELTLPIEPSP